MRPVPALVALVCAAAVALTAGCGSNDPPTGGGSAGGSAEAPVPARAIELPAGGDVLIAALGDSITGGYPLWDPNEAVRGQIGDAADERSQYEYWAKRKLGSGIEFRNCGVPQERTDQIAARLDQCAEDADVLIVQGGINDLLQGRSPEQAASNLDGMVERGKQAGLRVAIAEVLPLNAGNPQASEQIRDLNRRIAEIGREEDVPVLPWFKALEAPDAADRMRPEWTIDGAHPSVEGYRRLGRTIEAKR